MLEKFQKKNMEKKHLKHDRGKQSEGEKGQDLPEIPMW